MNRKLVVFVPAEALDAVRDAVFAAGAGRIGGYERCSWYAEGTGTFRGGAGTNPAVGETGREERVRRVREALEQSSGEAVSAYRAGRFAGYNLVLDLCCGSGAVGVYRHGKSSS